ncbi:YhcH/YjgK/YiaL family protein [Synergistes jonesii]|uniref:YhcH/YjgK/YiaL family protein n=1 Tax=Synergistes jonesii TaxID=2754 RepID=UPI003322C6AB
MIYDTIDNFIKELPKFLPRAAELSAFLAAAREKSFDELKGADFSPLDLRFGEYDTKPAEEIPFEAHKRYWDLQIVVEGEELIGYAPLESLSPKTPYDEENDVAFYEGEGQELKLARGLAILLAPWEGHRPGTSAGKTPRHVRKIVVKLPWRP